MKQILIGALLGCVLMLVIGAASVDTTGRFGNMNLSGYLTLSGETNRLTVADGALKLDGSEITGGGESLWTTNSDGWITPMGGAYLTNTLVFKSGLANNTTNRGFVVKTASSWTSGDSQLLGADNNETNVWAVGREGQMLVGRRSALWWGFPAPGDALIATGDSSTKNLVLGRVSDDEVTEHNITMNVSATAASITLTHSNSPAMILSGTANSVITARQVVTEPDAPGAGMFTLFAIDNGGGKMVLKVRFPTGTAQVLATEP